MITSFPSRVGIPGCDLVPLRPNADARGCLYEIYRSSWDGAFPTVQWNACVSNAGVVRGVHVHVDYEEFYTLVQGKVVLGLHDIRPDSPTFGRSSQFEWSAADATAVVVPRGVAHVVWFVESAVLAFGLSDYWRADMDTVGCHHADPALGFSSPLPAPVLSTRDDGSGSYAGMLADFEDKSAQFRREAAAAAC